MIYASYALSIYIKKPVIWGMPPALSIEPTSICNLKCPECPSGSGKLTRKSGVMTFKQFQTITDQVYKDTFYFQLFFQGEPFLHKDIYRMFDYAREKQIYTSVSTNGQLLNEDQINNIILHPPDKIIFSVDGIDEKSYQNYRVGGTFSKVDQALRTLVQKRKDSGSKLPFIEFQLIVMKQNEHLLKEVVKYAKQQGADKIALKTMQVYDYDGAVKFLPVNPGFSRYLIKNNNFYPRHKLRNRCFALYKTSVITWDGRIVPCCFDKNADYSPGSLNGKSIEDIWYSKEYQDFRGYLLHDRKSVSMCTNCTQGVKEYIPVKSIL
jgi:radical SAM protein with 4Fe4S-binding SPASM domain